MSSNLSAPADLIVDAIYEGTSQRLAGKGQDKHFVALFTAGQEKDWPDRIDLSTGQFTYYGTTGYRGTNYTKHPGR